MSELQASAVCAIVVAWRADLTLLNAVVQAARVQVGALVVVDNGPQEERFEAWVTNLHAQGVACLPRQENPGLAAGFNRGIEYARAHGFTCVLLLDQDSLIADDMVQTLLDAYCELSTCASIAAVGPQFIDRRTSIQTAFVRFGFPFNHKREGGPGQQIGCDFLISSGSLIPLAILDQVGMMDETLFIDNIDMDWCMRATAQGHALYGICDAKMHHAIGLRLIPSRWQHGGIIMHNPQRLYYSTRNRILLYSRRHVPAVWVAQDLVRLFIRIMRMTLLIAPRRAHFRAIWHGLCDGLRGRDGRRPGAGE